MTLENLEQEAADCTACELHAGRLQPVFAKGDHTSDIMICGMVPAKEENATGIPFVGKAGKLLDVMLEEVGLTDKVYITNLVKCFVASGETLSSDSIKECGKFLDRQILMTRPKIIISLGADASFYLTKSDAKSLGDMIGKTFFYDKHLQILTTYHPSYIIRNGGDGSEEYITALETLKLAKKLIAE